ncbi:MAG: host attachment protein [Burkholderiaceae bacterium]
MHATRTWILIADGAHARFFEHREQTLREIEHLNLEGDRRLTREIATDRPGRAFDSIGKGRHAIPGKTDPHRENEHQFARKIAEVLHTHLDQFERVILVAAPSALGDLRKCLSMSIQSRVIAELNQDLTGLPLKKIQHHLSEKTILAF